MVRSQENDIKRKGIGKGNDKIKKEVKRKKGNNKNIFDEKVDKVIQFYYDKFNLAEQIWEIKPYFYDKNKLWWIWNDDLKYWEVVDDTEILVNIRRLSFANTIKPMEKSEIVEAMKQYGREKIPKPIKSSWIQFKDIIIDIETGEQIKASPEYFVTNPIPYGFVEATSFETPVMDKIFEDWVGKDYVQTLYEIIAYCLLPDYPLNRIFCFIGAGMNGKSCFLNLLRRFVGENNVCSTELDTLITSRFEVTRLHKKLVCQMGETNFNKIDRTSLLKKLSGGDLIGFEYKRKNPFEDKNYAKIIIATNNLPVTSDKTIGFYRRWLIIDFPNRFSEKKDILREIPEQEYNNLAMKSIFILRKLLEKRGFHNEGSVEDKMRRYEARSNFLEEFLRKYTTEKIGGFITKAEFSRRFRAWCKENNYREMSDTSLGLAMRKLEIESSTKYFDWLNDGRGGTARVWLDIIWKEDTD